MEFVLSLSAKETNNDQDFTIESHLNIDKYEEDTPYYNFQIWANSSDNLLILGNEVVNLLEVQKDISSYILSNPPPVFVKKGFYKNGVLSLNIINSNNSNAILFDAGYKETETSSLLSMSSIINLNDNYITGLDLTTGNLFDLGFRIGDGVETPDDLFMSEGPWRIDDNASTKQILEFEISTNATVSLENEYQIERNPYVKTQT